MRFRGEIDPETGKFSSVLNLTWYEKNKKELPKYYYDTPVWVRKYNEPKYFEVVRKLRWTWDQVQAMLDTTIGNEKVWKKMTDEQKIQTHAERCLLPGEYKVEISIVE